MKILLGMLVALCLSAQSSGNFSAYVAMPSCLSGETCSGAVVLLLTGASASFVAFEVTYKDGNGSHSQSDLLPIQNGRAEKTYPAEGATAIITATAQPLQDAGAPLTPPRLP